MPRLLRSVGIASPCDYRERTDGHHAALDQRHVLRHGPRADASLSRGGQPRGWSLTRPRGFRAQTSPPWTRGLRRAHQRPPGSGWTAGGQRLLWRRHACCVRTRGTPRDISHHDGAQSTSPKRTATPRRRLAGVLRGPARRLAPRSQSPALSVPSVRPPQTCRQGDARRTGGTSTAGTAPPA